MKQFIVFILIGFVLFTSCTTRQETKTKNLIVYENVEAIYSPDTILFQNKLHYDFFKILTEAVLSKKIKVYDFPIESLDFSNPVEIINLELIKNFYTKSKDTISKTDTNTDKTINSVIVRDHIKDIRNIFFVEDWKIDRNNKFSKTVKYYAPVSYYDNVLTPGILMTTVSYVVKNHEIPQKGQSAGKPDKKGLILIASHITYTLNLDPDSLKRPVINGLNKKKLISILVDSVIKGKMKVYEFDFSKFDISSKIISPEEIKKNLGETIDSIVQNDINGVPIGTKVDTVKAIDRKNEIKALFFVENWYYNPKTFSFIKEVVGVGPVREYVVSDAKMKSIPFIISMQ